MSSKFILISKKVLKIVLTLILGGIIYSFSFTTYEYIKVNKMFNAFKNRATNSVDIELDYGSNYSNEKYIRRMWVVPRETSFEQDGLNVFSNDDKTDLGRKGDIFTTRQSPFPDVVGFHQFMTYYYGGHAAIYDGSKFLEATGYPDSAKEFFKIVLNKGDDPNHGLSTTASTRSTNYWTDISPNHYYYNKYYRTEYVGLRLKGADDNMRDAFVASAQEKIDNNALYNFLFFLDMKNKYYCTDLVSRAYEEAYERVDNNSDYKSVGYAKKLNDDGFITSVNDLILSDDSYIHFFVEITEEDETIVENIYYLEDVE